MVYFSINIMRRRIKTCLRGMKIYRWLKYIMFILVFTLAIIYLELRILSKYRSSIVSGDARKKDPVDQQYHHDRQLYIYAAGRYKPFVPKVRKKVDQVSLEKDSKKVSHHLVNNGHLSFFSLLNTTRTLLTRNSRKDNVIIRDVNEKESHLISRKTKTNINIHEGNKITKSPYALPPTISVWKAEIAQCKFEQHPFFPFCSSKVYYLRFFWGKDPCFHKVHKVNGSECSIHAYLTKIEPYCMGGKELYEKKDVEEASMNFELDGLLKLFDYDFYRWMRNRISFLWTGWLTAGKSYSILRSKRRNNRIKVIVFPGSLEVNHFLFDLAGKGGPLGELIQWSDVIAALYILGYDVTVVTKIPDLLKAMKANKTTCATGVNEGKIDVIYTDINGVNMMMNSIGSSPFALYRCMLRVLDSFGTFPEFNFPGYPYEIPGGRAAWSNLNLLPTQFMTLYPHTHDNYFLGFVIPNKTRNDIRNNINTKNNNNNNNNNRNKALLYAKRASYIKKNERYLQIVSEYFEVHATCLKDYPLPSYIHNHGPVSTERVQELLLDSKLFIGVGFPFEGPGPLEAMANGAVYLQPKFDVPVNKLNNDFFRGKPTLRKLTSQNPYMEEFVGEPYCYTINVTDETLLRKTLQKIKVMKTLPQKTPKEFTSEGLIERVHAFTEYMNYCNPYAPPWPPLDHLQTFISLPGQSCKEFCMSIGLVCERTYFNEINKAPLIERFSKLHCNEVKILTSLHAPSVNSLTQICYIQNQQQTFSCMHGEESITRLCPCRNYEKEQSAICKDCL